MENKRLFVKTNFSFEKIIFEFFEKHHCIRETGSMSLRILDFPRFCRSQNLFSNSVDLFSTWVAKIKSNKHDCIIFTYKKANENIKSTLIFCMFSIRKRIISIRKYFTLQQKTYISADWKIVNWILLIQTVFLFVFSHTVDEKHEHSKIIYIHNSQCKQIYFFF